MSAQLPKLIAFDLDGTLAENKQRVSAEMGDLLAALLAKMPVAVMSGASYRQVIRQFLDALPSEAPLKHLFIFPDNAAQCFVYVDNKWRPQYDHSFSTEEKARISEALAESVAEVGFPTPAQVWGERIEDRGAEIAFSALGQDAPTDAKETWNRTGEPLRDALIASLTRRLPDFSITKGGLTTVHVTRKGITKSYGIHRLTELTHIPVSDMLYVSDALDTGNNETIATETGIRTHAVFGPTETAALIQTFLQK